MTCDDGRSEGTKVEGNFLKVIRQLRPIDSPNTAGTVAHGNVHLRERLASALRISADRERDATEAE